MSEQAAYQLRDFPAPAMKMMNKCLAIGGSILAKNAMRRMESAILDNFFVWEGFGIDFVLAFGVIVIVAVMSG